MYNSKDKIMDEELTFLSFEQKINREFSASEIITSDLWSVTLITDNLFKAIPLFNCDYLLSSNSNDKILDNNKCIILHLDNSTVVSAVSDDVGSTHFHSVELYAFTPYTRLDLVDEIYVYCIIGDEYLNTLNNSLVNVVIDGDVVSQISTNNQGLCKYRITEPCTIQFVYDEIQSNTISIIGGE